LYQAPVAPGIVNIGDVEVQNSFAYSRIAQPLFANPSAAAGIYPYGKTGGLLQPSFTLAANASFTAANAGLTYTNWAAAASTTYANTIYCPCPVFVTQAGLTPIGTTPALTPGFIIRAYGLRDIALNVPVVVNFHVKVGSSGNTPYF
jgi:hypothetical protein